MGAESGVFAGIREDYVETTAHRLDKKRKQYATSAFARYEHYLRDSTLYAGLGIADRIPDFWEVSKVDGMNLSKETKYAIRHWFIPPKREFKRECVGICFLCARLYFTRLYEAPNAQL